jgi:hypothetical protein
MVQLDIYTCVVLILLLLLVLFTILLLLLLVIFFILVGYFVQVHAFKFVSVIR